MTAISPQVFTEQCDGDPEREETLADLMWSRLLTVEQLRHLPPAEPLVDGVLFQNTLSVLYGKRGEAKSFVALDLGLCVATGTWWHRHQVAAGPVLYVVAEGASGISRRVDAWLEAQRLHSATEFRAYPGAVNLFRTDQAAALADVATRLGARLVIIDTLARSAVGAEENSAKDMGIVVDNAETIRRRSGACVVLVHHTRKDGLVMRGSGSIDGAAETMIECSMTGQRITLRSEKAKDTREFNPIALYLQPIANSCVVVSNVAATSDGLPESRATVLDLFGATFGAIGATKADLRDTVIETLKVDRSTAYRAINDLVTLGLLRNTGSKERPFLVLPEPAEVATSQTVASHETQSSHAPPLFRGCDVRHDDEDDRS